MNIKPTFTQDSQACEGVRFTMRVLNQIARAERDVDLMESRGTVAELFAEMQGLPDPDDEIRRIEAGAKKEARETTPDEQEKIGVINARPETAAQRIARAKLDHHIGLIITRVMKPAYIRASLVSIEGFDVDGKPAAAPWESLLRGAPDGLIDELYIAAIANSGLSEAQEKN